MSTTPVAIVMGSKSDLDIVQGAFDILDKFGVKFTARVLSAHRTPAEAAEFAATAEDKGFKVFAHYVYKGFTLTEKAEALGAYKPHTQRISLGIQYIIPVL